jgi:plastocyanin
LRAVVSLVAAAAVVIVACGELKEPTAPPGVPAGHIITVSSFRFTPDRLEIRPGDRVTWRNAEGFHNVQADDGSFRCAEGCDRDGGSGDPSAEAWSFSRDFADAGAVRYFCEVHGAPGGSGMSGLVVVRE